VRFVNENAVTRSIRNLMLTNKNERLFQPNIGTNINRMLFEPMGSSTATAISGYVADTIEKYEPRAKVIEINVIPDYERGAYTVNVSYFIINKQEPVTTQITLYRVR
jgi:phage baseplate assembly protein W